MPKAKDDAAPARKTKAKKDPNAPKRPMHAYMWFCKDKRDEVKATLKDPSITEISKKLGEAWKLLSDDEKEPYSQQAAEDKER